MSEAPDPEDPNYSDEVTNELIDWEAVNLVRTEPIPPEERTRRTLMVVSGIVWGLLFFLNIGFALFLSAEKYQAVGATVSSGASLAAGVLGAGVGYYFAQEKRRE